MYNSDIKERYISDTYKTETSKEKIRMKFDRLEKFEIDAGKDLCQMKGGELSPLLDHIMRGRRSSVYNNKFFLSSYAKWCIENKVDGAAVDLIDIELDARSDDSIRRWTIKDAAMLQELLDTICDEEDLCTASMFVRAYLWLAYIGISNSDAFLVNGSDVNIRNMTVKNPKDGRLLRYPPEAHKSLSFCATQDEFVFIRNGKEYPLSRDKDGQLIRGHGTAVTEGVMRGRLSALKKKCGVKDDRLTYTNVRASGIYIKAFEFEKNGLNFNFRKFAYEYISDKTFKDKDSHTKALGKVEKNYESDYALWKRAWFE